MISYCTIKCSGGFPKISRSYLQYFSRFRDVSHKMVFSFIYREICTLNLTNQIIWILEIPTNQIVLLYYRIFTDIQAQYNISWSSGTYQETYSFLYYLNDLNSSFIGLFLVKIFFENLRCSEGLCFK